MRSVLTKFHYGYNATHAIHLKEWKLVYYPKNKILERFLSEVVKLLKLDGIEGVNSSEEVEKVMIEREFLAGVVFNHSANIKELPQNLVYTLRFPSETRTNSQISPTIFNWQTNLLVQIYTGGGPRGGSMNEGGAPYYLSEGFLPIQEAIARTLMAMKCTENSCKFMPSIQMHRYPYPPYVHDVLLDAMEKAVALFIMLSFVYPIISTVRFIAVEREKQLKEVMKIMGMPVWLHWTSWFVQTMIFIVVSISFIVGLLKIPMFDSSIAVFTNSDWSAIWVFLFVYSITMSTYCFVLSVLFSRANTSAAVAGLVWFISYMPYVFLSINHLELPLIAEIFACLSPNVAMAYGCRIIVDFERSGTGLQWSNFWNSNGNQCELTLGIIIYCLLQTAALFLLITLYIEKVFPGEYGVPEKWIFFLKKKFWFKKNDQIKMKECSNLVSHENFEAEPLNCVAGVRVKNLRKMFDNGKVACNGVTFNMFCDQITVLLGHNGAGKSTTLKMLTGMIPPTSGTAIINGYDIRTDLLKARESIGICPQHNILFDELTVREHIEFYSRLKGLRKTAVEKEVKKYVQLLNLESKIDSMSKLLSGGMKRKLAFGIALCGDSKVVLCDEPTSGMDPAARRDLWDLIQSEKIGRTIILTTHFMDEADVLGDRIAIMADGEVKCCGTPFFLKKRFGDGYRLICVKKEDCVSSEVTKVLQEYIPDIDVTEEIAGELSYSLPYQHVDKFGKMFERLESDLDSLKLQRFGVSSTELEEVFLKVGSDSHSNNGENDTISDPTTDAESLKYELLRGLLLRVNQWYAMFKKRYYCWKNSWFIFLVQNVMIVLFVVMSIACVRMAKDFMKLPLLEVSLNHYGDTVTMLQTPKSNDSFIQRIFVQYRKGFRKIDVLDEFSENMEDHFLRLGNQIRVRTNTRNLLGLSFENNSFIVWFNGQPIHTSPLSLNLLHNAMLRAAIGEDHSIQVSNWPIPFRPESKALLTAYGDDIGSQLATNLSFVMAFASALYIMFYIRERASKAKLLQLISGVDTSTFWMTSFLFDYMTHVLSSVITFLAVMAFQESGWSTIGELTPLLVLFIVFGLATLAITFVASFLFSTASYGFVSMVITFIFTGISFFNLIKILSMPDLGLSTTANMLKWIFLSFPHYALASSLLNMNQIKIATEVCHIQCERMQNTTINFEIGFDLSIPIPQDKDHLIDYAISIYLLLKKYADLMHADTIFQDIIKYINLYQIDPIVNGTNLNLHIKWNETVKLSCDPKQMCDIDIYAWNEPGIGRSLTYMGSIAIVFIVILWIIEYRIFSKVSYFIRGIPKKKLTAAVESTVFDTDVREEKNKVNAMTSKDLQVNSLVLRNLKKIYGNFLAVNGISVAVKRSECFGLLGINGAGKTSTFKMITGDTPVSSGDVFVNGLSLKTHLAEVHKMIGYCPQFDALLDNLTGSQTLEIFGLLRGYRRKDISAMSARLASNLNFTKHIDKVIKSYSGGSKRKLSTAIAIMSHPDVVYLDEPSSGMDPGAKRNLWNVLSQVRCSGTSIVLTSHSMEECEAICTRLAIMVNGQFKCLGSVQHLKNQFSKGFLLTIKIRSGGNETPTQGYPQTQIQISNFIHTNFPGAYLKEKYQGLLTFYVPQTNELKWSSMFDLMETAKGILSIEDYTISQTTLEQVFLSFTKTYDDQTLNSFNSVV
ncbi:phospholipid-transporting ATPase ABCA3-like isoform X2 [Sitodiplosis mosellana]|uniref:phospholipid-transporting ATPase ABCA3-like isoform X2 n=1 Tax=Sitodiplosis mosellana TaxID=263140 RepID=UPI0024453033|nr:phospholipid-transporting ATPase ABCA3-like isoform X2 [Sitodiplosis mosellana]